VKLTFDEPIDMVTVDGREIPATNGASVSFTAAVPSGEGEWKLEGTARDVAGNSEPFSLRVVRSANASVTPVKFPGFTRMGDELNSLGYPRRIRHNATSIELIALDWTADDKPTLYVSSGFVTGHQYNESSSSSNPQTNVSAETIVFTWCKSERAAGLALPTDDQWKKMFNSSIKEISNPEPRGLGAELLRGNSNPWPIRMMNGKAESMLRTSFSKTCGFRVVFVP
jgi:hypothetical protein